MYQSIVAEIKAEVVGFVSMPMKNEVGEIGLIGVAPTARGAGVGAELLSAALTCMKRQGMRKCSAKVRVDNLPGLQLFGSLGFEIDFTRNRRWLGAVHIVTRSLDATNIGKTEGD
jgi:ribosomal protein S18 acetylase RimI-like enzyme